MERVVSRIHKTMLDGSITINILNSGLLEFGGMVLKPLLALLYPLIAGYSMRFFNVVVVAVALQNFYSVVITYSTAISHYLKYWCPYIFCC
jgi:hypothetical protein